MENKEYSTAKPAPILAGLSGSILSAAIVAVRAFQPNSAPMEDWSFLSWILMTLPVTWPAWYFVLWWSAAFAVEVVSAVFRKRR